ncbi:MotA/TolQ/ExbB proton channel family protein [Acaryochloris sp. IP29b_bin.137]|uniref:MotA/TolQ/ExbB proton channel family protein n=1 Tax=Acaryochloris sp. IP29b_bin.137 TaxID=2969217 RepID=UPI0026181F45|nr:MotA/TolQ/ExbB proton channel family protein [Acaryochloris sp. IP29b_bin.137]
MNIIELFEKGGPTIWPLLGLSVLAIGTVFERLWFWSNLLKGERKTAKQIIDAARRDWDEATHLARQSSNQPIGRFLFTPLRLANQEPEIFRLALEASADEELTAMRKGSKVLEAVIALSPLLGLFGTIQGLQKSLGALDIEDLGKITLGLDNALTSTWVGLLVAIVSLTFYRLFQGLVFNQARIFRRTGNELELVYRQFWLQSIGTRPALPPQKDSPESQEI